MNYDFRTSPVVVPSLETALRRIESAQLVYRAADQQPGYSFKHALVQDSAYASLTRHERKRLHEFVATALEGLDGGKADENAALLAFHFERAEMWERALVYLQRAAEHAQRAVAHREQIDLLTRAIAIAERLERRDVMATLYMRRAKSFTNVTQWANAIQDLDHALELTPPDAAAPRAQAMVDYAIIKGWQAQTSESKRMADQARAIATEAGLEELAANALSAYAIAEAMEGELRSSTAHFEEAFAHTHDFHSTAITQGMELAALSQYWRGNYSAALERNRQAVAYAREASDAVTIMRGLSNVGMALVGSGQYGEAFRVFSQARDFGQEHGLGAWLARQVAIEGGLHLELYDYATAEQLGRQAQEMARTYKFIVAIVSPGVDLLFNYARTGNLAPAARLEDEIRTALPRVTGAHLWLLGLRFTQARAELAGARHQWEQTLSLAGDALELSRRHGRVKYEALSLQTRARALKHLGRVEEALADARAAVELARPVGDPAMFVRAALAQLEMQGDDALATEARGAARRIARMMPSETLRGRFEAYISEWI